MVATIAARGTCFTSFTIARQTPGARQFIDITEDVLDGIVDSGAEHGLAVIASRHTTAAIVVNEHEPELLKDLDAFLHGLAPVDGNYAHNAVPCGPDEHPNGHAHCQALLLSSSATIAIAAGRALLGRYQRIFLVELDRSRPREVTVAILGM